MNTALPIHPERSLAELASTHAAASRVFQAHGLDFCCHGRETLAAACDRRGLDPAELIRRIERDSPPATEGWEARPLPELIDHLLVRFHEAHRAELPRLIALAERVEQVHAARPDCPRGLGEMLRRIQGELEDHMQKEEQVLFPLIRSGRGRLAGMPIQAMETEHRDHAANLARLRELTGGYVVPDGACGSWHALYLGSSELELELMRHIHLENHVLFPRALGA